MKEFFIECLKNLEALTGIRQLFFLQSDPEGAKKKDVLIDGMVLVSKKFDYIPEETQQKYIRKMMVEDQNYESLNSRVIWKWLDMHKVNHITHSHFDEDALTQYEPASPEVADYWANKWKEELAKVGQSVPKVTEAERKDPLLVGLVATPKPPIAVDPRHEQVRKHVATLGKWYHDIPNMYEIEGIMVPGDTLEEAQEIYINATL